MSHISKTYWDSSGVCSIIRTGNVTVVYTKRTGTEVVMYCIVYVELVQGH